MVGGEFTPSTMTGGEQMNKKEVKELNNLQLIALLVDLETETVKQANRSRGITKKTSKEYRIVLEEVSDRFNIDLENIKSHKTFDWLYMNHEN